MPGRFINDDEAMYNVGDRVLITNPIDLFEDEDKTVYTITDVKFNERYGVFAYKLDGGTTWVNEAWLEADLFGPKIIEEEGVQMAKTNGKKALQLELDYELASLHDAMANGDEKEKERSKARLAEIHAEMLAESLAVVDKAK